MFELITPASYWILTGLWLVILVLYLTRLRHSKHLGRAIAVLLVILSIDAFRTVFESIYFGMYFNSLFGVLPKGISVVLADPRLIIIPKMVNVLAGIAVLYLLIRHWSPDELRDREVMIAELSAAKVEAEKKKEEAEQEFFKFRAILNAISDGIVFVDQQRRIVASNKGMEKTFGYVHEDLVGNTTLMLYESQEEFDRQGRIRFNLSAKEKAEPYEVRYRRKNGEVFIGETLGTPVLGGDGAPIGFIGVIRDVTERKALEAQVARSQKMEAIGQLTGGVAHDFNNLLAAMMGNAELLSLEDDLSDDSKGCIDEIKKAVNRAASLTTRLLAFSRQQALDPEPTDVTDLISGLTDLLRRTLGETVELVVVSPPGLWSATIDAHQFEHALVNLAVNARDAMPDGGKLVIETANVSLDEITAQQMEEMQPGDYVQVAVSDTGIGMSPAILEKAFDPFFTTKGVGKGSGLGLSMVYGFAKQSRGSATLYSEPGHGTTVKLYLPRSPVLDTAAPEPLAAPMIEPGNGRVLVVEDDLAVRRVSVGILREHGYQVVEASDGPSALASLDFHGPFDLLFTDVVLPGGMTGPQIAEAASLRQPGIKVIYTTGYAEQAVLHSGHFASDTPVVNKPYQRSQLLEKVASTLKRKALVD